MSADWLCVFISDIINFLFLQSSSKMYRNFNAIEGVIRYHSTTYLPNA